MGRTTAEEVQEVAAEVVLTLVVVPISDDSLLGAEVGTLDHIGLVLCHLLLVVLECTHRVLGSGVGRALLVGVEYDQIARE